ncbi:hypothetical protein DSM104299_04417 [Baekduia alba]|uniref:hypothetical protein n=1 Tax=Baekduia alba TaxID=2997333 RepID=UPI00233FAB6F|nr:hypothetical protein [Baekduia alba]WCB95668.1 hypothetical protein DSM104299_04417 [Baekduia alba]
MPGTLSGTPQRSAHLHLVEGELAVEQSPEFEFKIVRRPGEQLDAFLAQPSLVTVVREIATQAARRGLLLDLATALVVEHGLVLEQIREISRCDAESLARSLDGAAAVAVHDHVARGPEADYLRALIRARDRDVRFVQQPDVSSSVLALPVRLLNRGSEAVGRGMANGSLDVALNWEIAAVTGGQSMGEWAAWQLVQRPAAPPV